MKCPYAVHRTSLHITSYKYNEDGQYEQVSNVDRSNASFVDCLEKDCGVYQDGKCCYVKGV